MRTNRVHTRKGAFEKDRKAFSEKRTRRIVCHLPSIKCKAQSKGSIQIIEKGQILSQRLQTRINQELTITKAEMGRIYFLCRLLAIAIPCLAPSNLICPCQSVPFLLLQLLQLLLFSSSANRNPILRGSLVCEQIDSSRERKRISRRQGELANEGNV